MFKFQKLVVWEKSIELADSLLSIVEGFPQMYQFSLGDQLRRSLISVPTNIAEGSGRKSNRESANFYNIAKGSLYEVISLLTISSKRRLLPRDFDRQGVFDQAEEIARMISGLIRVNS